jgi:hypothetical protein
VRDDEEGFAYQRWSAHQGIKAAETAKAEGRPAHCEQWPIALVVQSRRSLMGSSSSPIAQPVSISDLVKDVASELRTLKNSPPRRGEEVMTLSECEIELSVGATMEASGGLKFYVVEVGGKGSTSASHRIKLKFSASDAAFAVR